jgi:acetyl-CoA synthetase
VLSAGFGEVEEGRALEAELREAALTGDFPVCGPNGNGIISMAGGAGMWGDSLQPLAPGPVAMISQSGNVAVNALGSTRGIGWHTVVSTGNQAVCEAGDWLAAVAELDGVRSIAMFLEADGDGAKLAEALARCAEREIGVAVLKVGESATGAWAASAHTGALAGDHRIFRALVEEAGAAWASDPHELLELARALAAPRGRPRGDGGLAVLTCSGGDSGIAADLAARAELPLPVLAPGTRTALAELLPGAATVGNPLDYTALIWGKEELLERIIRIVGADPAIDQLLLLFDHPHTLAVEGEESWLAVQRGIAAGAAAADAAPIVASTLPDLIGESAIADLAERGVPAIAGLAAAIACAVALRRPPGDPARLRELAAAARARTGDNGSEWLGEAEAKQLLRDAGVPVPDGRLVADPDEAAAAAQELGLPVALKLSGPRLRHKSDLGALELNLDHELAVREAHERLAAHDAAAEAEVLIERMVDPGLEVIVAARADAVVPALVIGLGGIWAETLDDVAIVPLPASSERIERAITGLRAAPLLTGGRGRRGLDVAGLAALAARIGQLLLSRDLELVELNPVVVHERGCVALDALAR